MEIEVVDNRIAIPKTSFDKIFQPFLTPGPTGQGKGLGLSLTYDIIAKRHDGKMKIKGTGTEGTSFIVRIPKTDHE